MSPLITLEKLVKGIWRSKQVSSTSAHFGDREVHRAPFLKLPARPKMSQVELRHTRSHHGISGAERPSTYDVHMPRYLRTWPPRIPQDGRHRRYAVDFYAAVQPLQTTVPRESLSPVECAEHHLPI